MPEESVATIRAAYAAWNKGDMDAFRALHDPDVYMQAPPGWPEPGPEVGIDAVMRQFERLREVWEDNSLEPLTGFIEAGDRVVVRFIWHVAGRGPGSDTEITHVATVRNGKIVRNEYYWDHEEALAAAGLPRERAR